MTLQMLCNYLQQLEPNRVSKFTLSNPHSYRGYYEDLAFETRDEPQSAGEMLKVALSALGTTYQGWKGGDFKMTEHTTVWLSEEGNCWDATGLSTFVLNLLFDLRG